MNTLVQSWMLLTTTCTVSILLTPLDNSLPRKFTLNPSKSFIEIGRASKTASKGLASTEDNAWFDSPIMSRSHAELIVVTNPAQVSCLTTCLFGKTNDGLCDTQSLKLRDLRSTHGTFIGSKRISHDVDYAVKSGDVITFGTKVTSGQCKFFLIQHLISVYI